jgi:acyl-CoA synthetase (AMP-forming)/AMP-acid ligase II
MKMPDLRPDTLRQALAVASPPPKASLSDGQRTIPLADLLTKSWLGPNCDLIAGRSVAIAVETQLEAAIALVELDGRAKRMVLLPPDVKNDHLRAIFRDADVDIILCTDSSRFAEYEVQAIELHVDAAIPHLNETPVLTEWLMLTSGTTGEPKIAVHSLRGLSDAIPLAVPREQEVVWATFYDIRRFGGLQIFLRAIFGGSSLVLTQPAETISDHVKRLAGAGVTHVSGTPTHWRRVLMSSVFRDLSPRYIRLSGEIADQAVLDGLSQAYPAASIGHAYASTEAGVGFDVNDGIEGFPASYLDRPQNGVELRIVDGTLWLRSCRTASCYAGRPDLSLKDETGWVDSGDMVEIREGRCRFSGRRGGIINVGGLKVHPEEIEKVLNSHEAVRQSCVRPRKSPILGAIVSADVVLKQEQNGADTLKRDILAYCRSVLPPHKVPVVLNVVGSIEMTAGGKVSRQHA